MDRSTFSFDDAKGLIRSCLSKLYEEDAFLFERNGGKGVCERCLVFRFAFYLQGMTKDYFVDCDFNSSFVVERTADEQIIGRERAGKEIQNEDGSATKRFVDIIIHKRDYTTTNDLFCFEFKKWNDTKSVTKDVNNLKRLTSDYHYQFGFLVTFGQERNRTRWRVFSRGAEIAQEQFIFGN